VATNYLNFLIEGSLNELTTLQQIAVWILPILFAVTLHEAAHGYVAFALGDKTAYQAGRVSLNPLKHIDLVGTLILPIILMATTQFLFGWAKPVPVSLDKLKNPKRDFALVALAGPLANFLMALIWAVLLKVSMWILPHAPKSILLLYMSQAGISINFMLIALNLLPIPPLDGSRVITYLLPSPWDKRYNQFASYGFIIILILIVTGVLTQLLSPMVFSLYRLFAYLFGFPTI
jgi:Zn-dependent protease